MSAVKILQGKPKLSYFGCDVRVHGSLILAKIFTCVSTHTIQTKEQFNFCSQTRLGMNWILESTMHTNKRKSSFMNKFFSDSQLENFSMQKINYK